MKRISFAFCALLLLATSMPSVSARTSATPIPIVGCYSDLKVFKNEGMVNGNGSFTIRKVNGRYVATFVELMHDGGEYYPEVTIEHLRVNERKRIIKFDIALHSGRNITVLRGARGKVLRGGIKMNWRGAAEHGQAKPFMRRQNCKL